VAEAVRERVDRATGLALLEQMQLIRRFEEKAAEMYALGKIGGFLHLYIGQEAVAVGAMSTLRPDDLAIAGYREHGHILAKGGDPRRVMAELFGRRDGVSKGKGGSMHMFDRAINFLGGHAIVGGYLPIATGVGFAIRYEDRDRVILCFFGDGSVPQGEFHESLNLASLWKLPVVFICENNRYAMGTAIQRALAQTDISKFADAYAMPGEACDGMDVLAVRDCVGRAVARARASKTPTLVEARTYRFRGHSMRDPAAAVTTEGRGRARNNAIRIVGFRGGSQWACSTRPAGTPGAAEARINVCGGVAEPAGAARGVADRGRRHARRGGRGAGEEAGAGSRTGRR
jgi:pyruvate dehydrogenase E1 component alpha subunit